MKMGEGVNDKLKQFWSEQPKDVRVKVRFKSHLMLDMYFSAWSQGRMVATMEDLNVAIRIFQRQIIIRRVTSLKRFQTESATTSGCLRTHRGYTQAFERGSR
jgi:hypothetical protein